MNISDIDTYQIWPHFSLPYTQLVATVAWAVMLLCVSTGNANAQSYSNWYYGRVNWAIPWGVYTPWRDVYASRLSSPRAPFVKKPRADEPIPLDKSPIVETPAEVLHRQEIAVVLDFMRKYSIHLLDGKKTKAAGVPSVNNERDYFWRGVWRNKSGTFINEHLADIIPTQIDDTRNLITVEKIQGKYVLTFYIDGKLEVATYVSPGSLAHKTSRYPEELIKVTDGTDLDIFAQQKSHPRFRLVKAGYRIEGGKRIFDEGWYLDRRQVHLDATHASNAYDDASMPFAFNLAWGEWVHGSSGAIDGTPHSHGCIRTPLFYVKRIYDLIRQINLTPGNQIVVRIRKLY